MMISKKDYLKIKNREFVWDDLFSNHNFDDSILEYIDPREQNTCLVAVKKRDLQAEKKKMRSKKTNIFYKYTHL